MKQEKIRLQKFLSQAGVASRREAERLILRGRVMVNGKVVTKLGTSIDPELETVEVDGRTVSPQRKVYILLNKPSGYLCSLKDRFGRPLVTDLVPEIPERIYHVGRLDLDSEGLLVMTNDGSFANLLTHPGHRIEKTYSLELKEPLSNRQADLMKKGVRLSDGFLSGPARVEVLSHDRRRVEITIREGKKRQVKRMIKAVGNEVKYLKRVAIGSLKPGNLPPGKWRQLTGPEIWSLKNSAKQP